MTDQQAHKEITQAIRNIAKSIETLAPHIANGMIGSQNSISLLLPLVNSLIGADKENSSYNKNETINPILASKSSSSLLPQKNKISTASSSSSSSTAIEPKIKQQKTEKDPNAPKRPAGSFFLFCHDFRSKLQKERPSISHSELTSELGRMWRDYPDKEKYNKDFEKLKKQYNKDLDEYNHKTKKLPISISTPTSSSINLPPPQLPLLESSMTNQSITTIKKETLDPIKKEKKDKKKKIKEEKPRENLDNFIRLSDQTPSHFPILNQQFTNQFSTIDPRELETFYPSNEVEVEIEKELESTQETEITEAMKSTKEDKPKKSKKKREIISTHV